MRPAIIEAAASQIFAHHNRSALPSVSLVHSSIAQRYLPPRTVTTKYNCKYSSGLAMSESASTPSDRINGGHRPTGTTRYRITSSDAKGEENIKKWIRISFDDLDDTTSSHHAREKQKPPKKKIKGRPKTSTERKAKEGDTDTTISRDDASSSTAAAGPANNESKMQSVPESVLRYQRQMRKIKAADRAGNTTVTVEDHLRAVYSDDDIVVTNKPSGILCVPGVNKHRSLLDLVFEEYGSAKSTNDEEEEEQQASSSSTAEPFPRDSMIVHRLDMDTSGIVIFARTRFAMSKLHTSFRERIGTKKVYEALLVGWLDIDKWMDSTENNNILAETVQETDCTNKALNKGANDEPDNLGGGEINLPLQRDHRHPPFMRVSTPESEAAAREAVKDLNHAGYKKLIAKKPKQSTTQFRILSHETWMGHPVTRVELTPITGRTHQLRVHCAALGHPIVGDQAYGFCGEAHPNGGFTNEVIHDMSPTCATFDLRRDAEDSVGESGRTMCLHARRLTVDHPITEEKISFEAVPSF